MAGKVIICDKNVSLSGGGRGLKTVACSHAQCKKSQAHIAKLSHNRAFQSKLSHNRSLKHTLQNCRTIEHFNQNCHTIGLSSTHCKTVAQSSISIKTVAQLVSRAHIAKLSQYQSLKHTLQNCRRIAHFNQNCRNIKHFDQKCHNIEHFNQKCRIIEHFDQNCHSIAISNMYYILNFFGEGALPPATPNIISFQQGVRKISNFCASSISYNFFNVTESNDQHTRNRLLCIY